MRGAAWHNMEKRGRIFPMSEVRPDMGVRTTMTDKWTKCNKCGGELIYDDNYVRCSKCSMDCVVMTTEQALEIEDEVIKRDPIGEYLAGYRGQWK